MEHLNEILGAATGFVTASATLIVAVTGLLKILKRAPKK